MSIIVFWLQEAERECELGYDNVNYESGFSGTDTMAVEMGTALASKGHEVYIICHVKEDKIDNNVHYTKQWPVQGDDNVPMKADVFVPMFFLQHHSVLDILSRVIDSETTVVVWLHCILKPHMWSVGRMHLSAKSCRVVVAGPSVFSLQNIPDSYSDHRVIPNAINASVFQLPALKSLKDEGGRRGNWVFHACWERGGNAALRIFAQYPDRKAMWTAAYAPGSHASEVTRGVQVDPSPAEIFHMGSMSKAELREMMLSCDYFVYPLVSPSGIVHHDTFACVVLEAMACGVLVLSWDVACLRECFGDHAILLPPPHYNQGDVRSAFGTCPEMNFEVSMDLFLDKIRELDMDPHAKTARRIKAAKWACTQTWDKPVREFESVLPATKTKI